MDPVFESARGGDGGELLLPTDSAVGPWNPAHLHGGPTCGAIARAAERLVGDADMQPARLTVDLFRPVPRRPLSVQPSYAREGKRIRAVQVSVLDEGTEVARGSVLYLLRQEMPEVPPWPGRAAMAGPEGIATTGIWRGRPPGHEPGFHMRTQARWATQPEGPQAAWFAMPMALVDDEPVTPFQRVATLGDFANAVASLSTRGAAGMPRVAFMNTDTTLYIARLPRGEWIGMEADHCVAADGVELAEVVHHDLDGRYGHSTQARMLMARPPGARRPSRK